MDDLPAGPVVHASLGTVVGRPDILHAIIEGLADEPIALVVASSPTQDPATFEPLPDNTRIAQYLPHSLLLPRCDAMITHAGAGTLIASIDAGLPMVLVPIGGDQPRNAEMAAAVGAGIMLDPATLTPEDVRDATRSVLTDHRYRESVESLRREIDTLPSHEDAVNWIEVVGRTKKPLPGQRDSQS
jgi:MGT family glycosyltransferase